MKNLAHSASLESLDKNAPSKTGTKHVVSATGAALGVVSTGDATADRDSEADVANALAACLTNSLPAWLLRALEAKED
jgi:hypothetical protein